MTLEWISFGLGLGFGVLIAGLALGYFALKGLRAKAQDNEIDALKTRRAELETELRLEKQAITEAREALSHQFTSLSQEVLSKNAEQFLTLAQEKLKHAQGDARHDLEKRQTAINELIKPIKTHLEKLEAAVEQAKGTDQSLMEQVQHLQKTAMRIDGALRNPRHQGAWGEKVLEGLLEHSGLMKGVHFRSQQELHIDGQKLRPDYVISLGDGLNIIVDAKAPIHDFSEKISETDSEVEYKAHTAKLAQQIRSHVQELRKRSYWEGIDNVDFTVMFLPSEHVFSAALQADPHLIDYAAESKIIVVSPTLMLSLLKVVSFSWRQAELAENAKAISESGAELHKRLGKFSEYLGKMGRGLSQAIGAYDDAVGSFEARVLPQARQLEELHVTSKGTQGLESPGKLEKSPRKLQALTSDT